MIRQRVIRLGDKLSRGGSVTQASGALFGGIPIVLAGDQALCAIHGPTIVTEGSPGWLMNSRPVAVEQCHTQCGCSLISSLPDAGVC
ncbi:PAAR domain-containing protein [Mangrovibacter yixingensis]|uniref:PAAR domain-containing protein n=1 Tax=Mangrovibacter yixingensis TaxID=1529639 RepID=UPI001CFA7D71|nr:PAAR domain-containing protein [Mangrovibacter yixingensis]